MKAPRISKDADGNYDLLLENGAFAWAEDGTQATQHAFVRLMIFRGEPSLNGVLTEKTEEGTKWLETIFNVQKSKAEKELEIKRRLLQTPGIKSITSFQSTQVGRTLEIEAKIQTDWGDMEVSDTIEPL